MMIRKNLCLCTLAVLAAAAWIVVYPGCRRRPAATPQMNADDAFWVRVLLSDDITDCSINGIGPVSILDSRSGAIICKFAEDDLPIVVGVLGGRFIFNDMMTELDSANVIADRLHIIRLNGRPYRGKLFLDASGGTNRSFDAINSVPLEPYVASVIAGEMPRYWRAAALEAQAIAARTYCMYIKNRFGRNRRWDVTATAASQVYWGMDAETGRSWQAADKTAGMVLVPAGGGEGTKFTGAYYCSSCGGHTENSRNVFGGSAQAAIDGVPCPYCRTVAGSNFFWPKLYLEREKIQERLFNRYPTLASRLGSLTHVAVSAASSYGNGKDVYSRATEISLGGPGGAEAKLRAEDFRLAVDPTGNRFRSTICRIEPHDRGWFVTGGRGYGHGAGMCQCGAEAMARGRKTAAEILAYYYPGSRIKRLYQTCDQGE